MCSQKRHKKLKIYICKAFSQTFASALTFQLVSFNVFFTNAHYFLRMFHFKIICRTEIKSQILNQNVKYSQDFKLE